MTTWIKLCGLSTDADVAAAVACDVQAIGFVFAESVRCVQPAQASALTKGVPDTIATVAVMLRPEQSDVDAVLSQFTPDFIQADWQVFAGLTLPGSVRALPVYRQGDGVSPEDTPPRFVYEGALSGQGETVRWPDVRPFADQRELILAGGLNPGNVADAMQTLAPFGVDVSSGIERERGAKDHRRMKEFVARVRAFDHKTS